MKILSIAFTVILLILSSSQQEFPELKEASDLTESVVKLMSAQKFEEALPLAKRALEIRERVLPRDDPRIGNSLVYLVGVYNGKRDFGKAKETLQRLLQYQTERFGAENVKLAPTLERLAALHFRDRDTSKAEAAYQRALALKEKEYGTDHVELGATLFALGELYRARRDFDRASPPYKRAALIYGKHAGPESAEFERIVDSYSCLCTESQKPEAFNGMRQISILLGGAGDSPAGTVLNGKALSLPKPDYPATARAHRLAGLVVVKVKIDETGKVVSAKDMCGGPPYLSESSVAAAYHARFTPTKLSGKPVPVYGIIQYHFVGR